MTQLIIDPAATGGYLDSNSGSGTWSDRRNAASAENVSLGSYAVWAYKQGNLYRLYRTAIAFNTNLAALRNAKSIDSLYLKFTSNVSGSPAGWPGDAKYHLVPTTWNPASDIVNGNYNDLTFSSIANRLIENFTDYDLSLNVNQLVTDGYTKFFIISNYDLNNQDPGDRFTAALSGFKLVVNYTPRAMSQGIVVS